MIARSRVNSTPFWRAINSKAGVLVAGLLLVGACGSGGGSDAGVGVSIEIRHTEPLRSQAPVRWSLVLRNDTPNRLDLEFPSGKDGDVVLSQGGAERYRWSTGRVFTTAVRELSMGPNETRTFALEDPKLPVPPGDYQLVATLAAAKEVPPVEKDVTVTG